MTKKLLAVLISASLVLVSLSASADETAAATSAANRPVKVLKTVVVVGNRQLPSVVIEIARLSAAHEAAVAHEHVHLALAQSTAPTATPSPSPSSPP